MDNPKHLHAVAVIATVLVTLCASCMQPEWNRELPPSADLGRPRGYRIARTLVHTHSPISYDACDKKGVSDAANAKTCLDQLRYSFCANRFDYAFITDHPNKMVDYNFDDLLLFRQNENDTLVYGSDGPVANRMNCPGGHKTMILAGFEDRLVALGMTRHIGATADERNGVYTGENIETAVSLRTNANAIVSIPHTESRSLDLLRSVKPDVIEIINIHASIDPKIRGQYLRQDYFEGIIDMVVNWIDPYSEQEPDLAFLAFLNFSPVYFEKWNTLLNEGMHIAPIAATDSHQNALTWTDRYDERLDSHRRLGRWLSNHYLLLGDDPGHVKSAVKYGRGWIVMEGLGTPVGMDFYAETAGGGYTNPGESVTLVPGKTFLKVKLPWLHPDSPSSGDLPEIKILLRKIVSDGSEAIVARTTNEDLTWEVKDRGIYRAEVTILPQHLKGFLNYKKDDYMRETTWIITNNIFVE